MNAKPIITLLFAATVLTGCQASPYLYTETFDIQLPFVEASEIRRSGEKDAFGQSEILSADNDSLHFGVAYVTTNDFGIIKDQYPPPHLTLKGWTKLDGDLFEYGAKGVLDLPGNKVPFERFSYPGHRCFLFLSTFHKSSIDDMGRYERMITGYFCQSGTGELPDSTIEEFLNAITIPRHSTGHGVRNLPDEGLFKPILPIRGRIAWPTRMKWLND